MHHYTDKDGWNGIRSTPVWKFRANKPPCDNPKGAYFTTLGPKTRLLAVRCRISKKKIAYMFEFTDGNDLKRLDKDRDLHIFYSPMDYLVGQARQVYEGERSQEAK